MEKRKKQSTDPTKKDASKELFGRRALAGGNMWDSLSCLLTLLESFDKNNPEMGIDSVARHMHQKTVQHYWVNIVKQYVTGGGYTTLRDTLTQPMEAALNQPTFLIQAQALLGKALASIQRNETKRLRVSSTKTVKWRLNRCNLGGRFVESVKNARWSMSPQEAGDGLESIVEFQVQIKGHSQREYEDK